MSVYLTLLGLLLTISLCGQDEYFPPRRGEWAAKSPAEAGFDEAALLQVIDFAMANEYTGQRDLRLAILEGFAREPFHYLAGPVKPRGGPAGLILKDGYIVAQWGDTERVDMTFSVTKSYLSTMAGLALDAGLIADVHDPVRDYVWDGTFDGEHNGRITWDHLLRQTSDWSGELWGMRDWADRPPREGGLDDWRYRELREPGGAFEYNDVRVNVLAYSLLQVWRKPLPQLLRERIMDPIGASTTWRWYGYEHSFTNVDGMMMQSVSGGGHSGGGLFINTLDHARFGLLFLRDGRWEDQQLISPEWIRGARRPADANPNYGYMWWLNTAGTDRHWEGVPEQVYYAAGFGGNFIVVDDDNQLVIVTRWLEPNKIGEFVRRVQAALTK